MSFLLKFILKKVLKLFSLGDIKTSSRLSNHAKNKSNNPQIVRLFLKLDKDKDHSYIQLLGYDSGRILKCQNHIENLLKEYKNWYGCLFNLSIINQWIPFLLGLSLANLLYKALTWIKINNDTSGLISFIAFFIFVNLSSKLSERLFPYFDLRFKETKRRKFWRWVLGVIVLGLLTNLIIWAIPYLLSLIK